MLLKSALNGSPATVGEGAEARSLIHFGTIAFQLALFLVLLFQFKLQSQAFVNLTLLTLFGWSIHYFLPHRHRMGFFVLLSLVGIGVVFGYQFEAWSLSGLTQGVWIVAIGLGLIGLCHIPAPFWVRVALIVAVGVVLIAARAGEIAVPWSAAVWPVVASMFMFRLAIYLHQMRHEKRPATVRETLSYFFMLPNVCFPLFPVIDYQTFRRCYYDKPDRHEIYQTGINWMFRGAIHLLLYRFVYQSLVNDAGSVENQTDLLQFLLWPFLLYLRVSGTFHIVTGMLHLFGFGLPETHKLYYLSASFTDFWRRINIYWKDFMLKMFYYPVYFRFRAWSETAALIFATFFVFLMTWLLHSYQWFWLRGTWLLTWNDFLFWMFLALLVVPNALYEVKRGRKRRLIGSAMSWGTVFATTAKTIAVFLVIGTLWSFWSANSVSEWLSAWSALGNFEHRAPPIFLGFVIALGVPAALQARGFVDRPFNFAKSAVPIIVFALSAYAISRPDVYTALGPTVRQTVTNLKTSDLNSRDFAKLERGYYENLLDVGGFNPELWEVYRQRPKDWRPLRETAAVSWDDELPLFELRPHVELRSKGALVRTNRWGMRDRDYTKTPPPNTTRIAFVGSSLVFGEGVENEETFDALLEARLNPNSGSASERPYEVLNFAVPGYSPFENLGAMETKVFEFQPDFIFYFEHAEIAARQVDKVVTTLKMGAKHPYGFIHEIARKAGIDPDAVNESSDSYALVEKLMPYKEEILRQVYRRMAEAASERGVPLVWIYLPRPEAFEQGSPSEVEWRLAREAGFNILDLSGLYGDHELTSLWIARWDHHPNSVGHRLIAEKLEEVLRAAQTRVPLGLSNP